MSEIESLKEMIMRSEKYKFIHNKNICLLIFGGSWAYGTNNENSDIDLRGIILEQPNQLIGLHSFEQTIDSNTDTILYGFNKAIRLFIDCNPNTIEMLGCDSDHILHMNEIGRELYDNRKLFLSKRCIRTFGGYANQQLRRLKNALFDKVSEEEKNNDINKTLNYRIDEIENKIKSVSGNMKLVSSTSSPYTNEPDIYLSGNLDYFPARNLNGVLSELHSIIKSYDKLTGRNKKKDDEHLRKHAMHLFRLYFMAFDILKKHEIITYRKDTDPILLDIRNGKFSKHDGTFTDDFWNLLIELEIQLKTLSETTTLPDHPNFDEIEKFVMRINKRIINNDI